MKFYFTIDDDGAARQVTGHFHHTVDGVDVVTSFQTLISWSDEERLAVGVHTVEVPQTPEGQRFADWAVRVVDGAVVLDAVYEKDVPAEVTRRQARLELHARGKLAALEAVVAGGGDMDITINYEDAATWRRVSPFVAQLAAVLQLTNDQVDDMFVSAAKR